MSATSQFPWEANVEVSACMLYINVQLYCSYQNKKMLARYRTTLLCVYNKKTYNIKFVFIGHTVRQPHRPPPPRWAVHPWKSSFDGQRRWRKISMWWLLGCVSCILLLSLKMNKESSIIINMHAVMVACGKLWHTDSTRGWMLPRSRILDDRGLYIDAHTT